MRNHQFSRESGQAIIMVSLGIMFLMGILGLVIDVGWGYYRKQVAQAAVDAAVLAAGRLASSQSSITCNSTTVCQTTPTQCTASLTGTLLTACQYATQSSSLSTVQNGIAMADIKVSANNDTTKNGVTVQYWVTASVNESLLPTFLRVFGTNLAKVGATATAGVVGTGSGSGGGCVYALDSTTNQIGLYLNGASLSLTCGVYVNSSSTSNAFQLNSAAAYLCYGTSAGSCTSGSNVPLNMVTGAKINCSGCGCKSDAYYGVQNPSNTTKCSPPSYGTAVIDPLSSLPAPSYSGCDHINYSWSNLTPPQTLNPGVFCGGITIGGGNVTLNPGTYVLNGGGLRIQGSNTTVSGNGVFFYNTSSGYSSGSLLMSGQPTVTLKSPTSGTYQGIFFMQDHSVCPSASHLINGNTNIKVNGTIYAHCTQTGGSYSPQNIHYTGQSSTGYYSALVVDTMILDGMSNLVLDPTGGTNTGIGLSGGSKAYLIQ